MNKDDNFTPAARKTMAVLVLVFGLFVTFIGPFLIQSTLDAVMEKVAMLIPTQPLMKLAGVFLPTGYIIMRGIGAVAGITLALIAYPLWKGEKWAWPVALSCLSLPTMFGVYTSLPYLVQFGKPAPAVAILLAGLIVYWWVLLLKKGDRTTKIARFFTFTMLGIVPGHIIVLVNHGGVQRSVAGHWPKSLDPLPAYNVVLKIRQKSGKTLRSLKINGVRMARDGGTGKIRIPIVMDELWKIVEARWE